MSFQVNPNQSQADHFRPCQMVSEYVAHDVAGVNGGAKGIEICEELPLQQSNKKFQTAVVGRNNPVEKKPSGSDAAAVALIAGGALACALGAPEAGVPLIALGLAGCETEGGGSEHQNNDLCDNNPCAPNGKCFQDGTKYYCACDEGFEAKNDSCYKIDVAIADTKEVVDDVGAEIPKAEDVIETKPIVDIVEIAAEETIYGPTELCTKYGISSCYSGSIALMCNEFDGPGVYSYKTVDCPTDQKCQNGKCVTKGGYVDDTCGEGWFAECVVTDEIDFGEDGYSSHNMQTSAFLRYNTSAGAPAYYYTSYSCGNDVAMILESIYSYNSSAGILEEEPYQNVWASADMKVNKPPFGTYYKLDIKHDFFHQQPDSSHENRMYLCNEPSYLGKRLTVQFGDEQRKEIKDDVFGEECLYQNVAIFNGAGIENDKVKLLFQNTGASCQIYSSPPYKNLMAVAKARIWSCKCGE